MFEVLFREETVIASTLKRGGKCHYTRITVAVTSAEKANELAASWRVAGVPGTKRKRFTCASTVWQELGARSQEIPRKGKEFDFLTQCLSTAR